MTHLREVPIRYADCVFRAEVRFIEGDPARIEGIWLISQRRDLGAAGLGALREAIEPVNALICAAPGTAFSFEDFALCDALVGSASGVLARAIFDEWKHSETPKEGRHAKA
ncbi:hypothetical protein [Hyphobacterium sp.]|uniref:hypothetical protein n=1 Tax=Hyphobacterium sp. TaxID=2004662 RepID=UPI003B52B2B5